MNLHEELLDFYKRSIESTGPVVNSEWVVVMPGADGVPDVPVTINDEPMVLPSKEMQAAGKWDGVQPYHPMSENPLRGESIVLKKLRVLIAARITSVLQDAMETLMPIAADSSKHAKLSPKASEFLSHVQNADERTLKALKKVMNKVTIVGDHRLVSFYFKRPGEQRKDSYTRVCNVDFPILDELDTKENTIFGVKMSKADKDSILSLFQWLLPLAGKKADDVKETYGEGTRTLTVPYLTVLLKSYVKLAEQLNGRLKLFKKVCPELVEYDTIDISWAPALDDLSRYRDVIPSLKGNEGAVPTHPGSKGVEVKETATPLIGSEKVDPAKFFGVRQNVNVDMGGSSPETTQSIPSPTQPQIEAPRFAPVAPPTVPAAMPVAPAPVTENTGKIKWGDMNTVARGPAFAPPISIYSNNQPIGGTSARDVIYAQDYNRHMQMPNAAYNQPDPYIHGGQAVQYRQEIQQPVQTRGGISVNGNNGNHLPPSYFRTY